MNSAWVSRLRKRGWRGTARAGADAALLRRAMWRLGLQVALCVAGIVVVLSGLAVLIVLRGQHAEAATLLRQAATGADDVGDPPAGMWLAIQSPTGLAVTPGVPAGLPDRAALRHTARTGVTETDEVRAGGREYRVYTVRRGAGAAQSALDLTADHHERDRLAVAMLIAGGLGLVLSAGLGIWLGRRAVRPMATALALQRRFVSDASHELRTPLTLLSTRAQMLRRHLRQGSERESVTGEVDGVVRDAGYLADILEDLLLAADTRTDAPSDTLDMVALADEVCAAAAADAAQRSITITARSQHRPVAVRGTRAGLRRALTALLDNAARHASTTVTVTVSHSGASVVVDVTDDGPGIDAAILPHLFQRFASTHDDHPAVGNIRQRRYGIGLALVSEIAARHGGTVSAHHAPGGGATLRLTLPALTQ
ncbi:MAG: sensor histidine kinase [Sciscionella sp.]